MRFMNLSDELTRILLLIVSASENTKAMNFSNFHIMKKTAVLFRLNK